MGDARYIVGDVFDVLATLEPGSVDLVMTSPPFLALRSYLPADHPDKPREIGSEATPGAFIDRMLDVVEACARVLAPHGSLVFELGDTYAGAGDPSGCTHKRGEGGNNRGAEYENGRQPLRGTGWPLDKSKVLIPQLFAVALAYGFNPLTGRQTEPWRVRNTVAWCRPNPPVGRDGDKYRPATSFLTVACKARDRYWDGDAVRTPVKEHSSFTRDGQRGDKARQATLGAYDPNNSAGAPLLDWWNIPTEPYPGAHYACVDAETEALTPHGWKRHDELNDGDLIAAYDADRGVTTWQPATFHRYPFDGELVAIEKRETSQRLTPNHRVLHMTRGGFAHTRRADEAVPSWRLPVAAPFEVDGQGPGDVLAALLGWYVTEGSARKRSIVLWQSESANPKHCNRIRDLLDAAGADYTERRRVRGASIELSWSVGGEVAQWLLDTAPGKVLPASVLGWSDAECEILLDALIDGDGHTRASGRRQFIQYDRATVDMVQALVCRLGMRSTISPRREGGYSLTIGERSWVSLRGADGRHDPVGREHYEGVVWCPSVAGSYWLARRNGRPFITGNTYPAQLVVPVVKAMCPQRVCRTCGQPSRRIVSDAEYVNSKTGKPVTTLHFDGDRRVDGENHWDTGGQGDRAAARVVDTLGWSDCGHDNWRPGLCLDPFAGSGTTLQVATGHGMDAIGIDLDARNADLAVERIGGLFLRVEVG